MNDTELLTFLSKGVLKWNFVEDITDIKEQVIQYGLMIGLTHLKCLKADFSFHEIENSMPFVSNI